MDDVTSTGVGPPTGSGPLAAPSSDREAALAWVGEHLGGLYSGELAGSTAFRGGQTAADAALDGYEVTGYARRRNEVAPPERRGASMLSPYIRHGLLPLRRVWDHVGGGPSGDVRKFRDELLWQEFARHWYARLGDRTRLGVRRELAAADRVPEGEPSVGWDRSMRCLDDTVGELERDGWLVNQTRMWLSSHWSVREGWRWQDGEDEFFRHLLDGSRAANRLGWQWTTGVGSSKHYGFSRWQVEKRAKGTCVSCRHEAACPIEDWPDDPAFVPVDRPDAARRAGQTGQTGLTGQSTLVGPSEVVPGAGEPDAVWLTAESLGDDDPALVAHPDLRAVFVFDRGLLDSLRLSAKRLVFLVETLADLATRRAVEIAVGDPTEVLAGRRVAVTHAPVPGFADRSQRIEPVQIHPWPWLVAPSTGSVASFSAWRKGVGSPSRRLG